MTPDIEKLTRELRERVASPFERPAADQSLMLQAADALASLVRERDAAIERCAGVAETFDGPGHIFAPGTDDLLPTGWAGCRRSIAAAIRSLSWEERQ